MAVTILAGDCRTMLPTLPAESVQCVVTSPPYFGLRDYGTATWDGGDPACDHDQRRRERDPDSKQATNGGSPRDGLAGRDTCRVCGARRLDAQIGLEATPETYVAAMVGVFREVRRVLRADGTVFLNMGDSYASDINGACMGQRFEPRRVEHGLKPKDLVGMPWRLAFALQADDYLGNIRRETDRAWLAALVDGEGCITILETSSPHESGNSYPPVLQVRMCDVECLEKAATITGYGSASPKQEPPSQNGQRASYQWRLNGRKAADTIAEIYPFLLIKRKQAIIAWNHQQVRESYETKRGVPIPAAALAKQRACRELIRRLNRREAVDLPGWMVEPPTPVGPGWYLRSDCIWAKPNPMPESVTDRPTKAHEYIFLLTKSSRYFYDADAVREPSALGTVERFGNGGAPRLVGKAYHPDRHAALREELLAGRNLRSVWSIPSAPFPDAHFATFPPALAQRCILAGTSAKGCCRACGAPWAREVESKPGPSPLRSHGTHPGLKHLQGPASRLNNGTAAQYNHNRNRNVTTGWAPACACAAGLPVPCTVLDPFAGSGTVGEVAEQLGRHSVLIELSPQYVTMLRARTAQRGLFAQERSS